MERDADEFAVRTTNNSPALASAICKAAPTAARRDAAYLGGAGTGITDRLDALTERRRPSLRVEIAGRVAAVLLLAQVTALAATIPTWALATPAVAAAPLAVCDDH